MSWKDRLPLANALMTDQIKQSTNNRLGAVYSALYGFWCARHDATTASGQGIGARRDAYSVILFNESTPRVFTNDFTSSPDQLLAALLRYQAGGNTNFSEALRTGQAVMTQYWSAERSVKLVTWANFVLTFLRLRSPVMIFLSDGECSVPDSHIRDLCNTAVRNGCVTFFFQCKGGHRFWSKDAAIIPFYLLRSGLFRLFL